MTRQRGGPQVFADAVGESFLRERRRFLRTLGHTALAAPFFFREMLSASSAQAAAAPRRLVIFATAMGTIKAHWTHPVGPLQTLGALLAPLQPYITDLNLVLGDGGGIHEGGGHGAWGRMITGLAQEDSGPAGLGNGASIDQFLGKQIGGPTRFPVLEFGAALNYTDGEQYCRLIYADGKKSMTAEGDPAKMFQRLYGAAPAAATPKVLRGPRAMVDRLVAEITSLQKRLSPDERTKLDVHLAALRDLEKQAAALATQTCAAPVAPVVPQPAEYINTPPVLKAQIDLMVNALACDMTRVVSFQIGQEGNGSMRFPFLGFNEVMHAYSHDDAEYGDGGSMYQMHLWFAQQFAYLVGRLKAATDSDGKSLLDNTWVVWLTPMGEGRKHDSESLPIVTAGGAGGAVRTGRSMVIKDRFINDLLTTMANVMGVPGNGYGDPKLSKGPLTELLV